MGALSPPRPLREDDSREHFECGRVSVDLWFRRHAWRNQHSGVSRVSVIDDGTKIAGFVSLSMGAIRRETLPAATRRNAPDPVPIALLGQLGVDKTYQGQGVGMSLLHFALGTALAASRQVGGLGVVLHPLDDGLRAFYARFGFEDLQGDPQGAMIVRFRDLEASGF
jgi:GNAT superfamily N-acetyltransferase